MNRSKSQIKWARAEEFFCVDLTHQLLHKVFLPVSESIWWLLLPILDCCLYRWYWIYCWRIIINPFLDQLVLNIDLKTLNSFFYTVSWVHEFCPFGVVPCFHHTPPLLRLQRQIQVKGVEDTSLLWCWLFWTLHGGCHTTMMVSFQKTPSRTNYSSGDVSFVSRFSRLWREVCVLMAWIDTAIPYLSACIPVWPGVPKL